MKRLHSDPALDKDRDQKRPRASSSAALEQDQQEGTTGYDCDVTKRWDELTLDDADEAVVRVKKAWAEAASRDASFPALFPSKTVDSILLQATCNVIDICSPQPVGGNGSNMLITGVRGTGKTTLMKGLSHILGVLQRQKLICIYHDYEIDAKLTPTALLSSAIRATTSPDSLLPYDEATDTFSTCLQKARDQGHRVAMFLDEIQVLYVDRDHPNYALYHSIVRDILALGKSMHQAFGVVSGSSSNFRDLAYKYHPQAIDGEYPNLSNNVYRQFHLNPVRDRTELEAIIQASSRPGEDAEECFFHTGGVGRAVSTYLTSSGPSRLAVDDREFKEALSRDMALFVLIGRLADHSARELKTLSWAEVRDIVQARLGEGTDFATTLASWLDRGFLYETEQRTYQVLVPRHLDGFRSFITSEDAPNNKLKGAVLGTIVGWGAPSAGHLIEEYLCERLFGAFDRWTVPNLSPDSWMISLNLAATSPGSVKVANLFFRPKPDNGIDGVFVCDDVDTEGAYEVHTLQVKSGRLNKVIPLGGRVAEINFDDQLMTGICAKARRGISTLIPLLAAHGIQTISRITFTLFTTKLLHQAAAKALAAGFKVGPHHVEGHLHDQDATLELMDEELRRIIAKKRSK